MRHLSKSKLISGWQCPKRLWLETFKPEAGEFSAKTEAAFAIGHEVGAAAQSLFPGGVLIGHDRALDAALRETRERLREPGPLTLFEATLRADGVLVRADVLMRNDAGRYRMIEVKASTGVKEYHLNDCAIQLWVLERAGLDVDAVELAHIDNRFVYGGDGDYDGLFAFADVTDEARRLQPTVPALVADLRAMLAGPEPAIAMDAHCTKPFECQFIDYCSGPPAEMPVRWLPGGRSAAARLERDGYRDIREIPAGMLTNGVAEWARRVTVDGAAELRPDAARELAALGWPRYYFDFETMGPAVPVFAGTRPYQGLPFQWSCHVEHADGRLEHREFLADGDGAPMRACADALIRALGDSGPILVYTSYEKGVLDQLTAMFPDAAAPLGAIAERLFDLYPVTKNNYYHPDMRGSWSLKAVLPTVAPDLNHAELDIVSVGTDAEHAFREMIATETKAERREELRAALLRYCRLDTEALLRLARFLAGQKDDSVSDPEP